MVKIIFLLIILTSIIITYWVAFYKTYKFCYNIYVPRSYRRGVTIINIRKIIIWMYNHLDLIKAIIQLVNTLFDFIDLL